MQKYKLIKSWRKTLTLQIKGGSLVIKAPHFTLKKTIEDFIKKHKEWIENKLKLEKQKKILTKEDVIKLKIKAKNYIPKRVEKISKKYGLKYNIVKITSAKTRWGSCTSKKNLNFTYRLIVMPPDVIDYVITHELAHLKEMNHSKKFWLEVENMMSDYKIHKKYLKEEGIMLN